MTGGGQGVKGAVVLLSGVFVVKNWPQTLSTETLGQIFLCHAHCHRLSHHKADCIHFLLPLQSLSDPAQPTLGTLTILSLTGSSQDLPKSLS